jgi:hypothetical protein
MVCPILENMCSLGENSCGSIICFAEFMVEIFCVEYSPFFFKALGKIADQDQLMVFREHHPDQKSQSVGSVAIKFSGLLWYLRAMVFHDTGRPSSFVILAKNGLL